MIELRSWTLAVTVVLCACEHAAPFPSPSVTTTNVLPAASSASASSVVHEGSAAGVFAFTDVTVLPMDRDAIVEHQTVIVRNGRIASINSADAPAPADAQVIDGRGRFLMPGMADMHAHVVFWPEYDDERWLLLWVANGVTTVRNMAGTQNVLAWRDRVAKGDLLGPTIFTAGPILDASETGESGAEHVFFHSAAEVTKEVEAQARAGYDFVKVYNGLSKPQYDAALAAARAAHMMVSGHIPRAVGLEGLAAAHEDSIDHAEEYVYTFLKTDSSDKRIAEAVRITKEAGITVTPTLVTFKTIAAQYEGKLDDLLKRPEVRFVPRAVHVTTWASNVNAFTSRKKIPSPQRLADQYRVQQHLVLALQKAGVRLLVGTDAPTPVVVPGFSEREELQELVAAGLTPYEALRAATANASQFLRQPGEFGVVTEGSRADLVLLEANPFDRVENVDRRVGVMVRGHWYVDAELRAKLDALAVAYHARGPRP
jgi:imidazolonepropionase-like amidohydrolase